MARANRLRAVPYLRGEWRVVALSAGLTSVAALAEASSLVLVVSLAEGLTSDSETLTPSIGSVALEFTFLQIVILAASLLAFSAITRILAGYVTIRRMTNLAREWRAILLQGFLKSTFDYSTTARKGDVLETAGQHATQGAQAVDYLALLLDSIFTMLILAGVAFALEPVVASVLLSGGALLLLVLRPISKRVRVLSARIAEEDVEYGNTMDEIVRINRDIRLYRAGSHYTGEADGIAMRSAAIDRRRQIYSRSVPVAYQTMGSLLLLLALAISFELAGASLTAMGGAALLLLRGIAYGQRVSTFQQSLAKVLPLVERVQRQLDAYRAHADPPGRKRLETVESIAFERVSYRYRDDGLPALENVSLVLGEHGITGLVGPSGSGKSTLAQLILRLRSPVEGRVLVNGESADVYDTDSWMSEIAFVPQETDLIHGTVSDNVGFFRSEVTQEDIESAIEAVGLSQLIQSLPDGYSTLIGPTVHNFSGGQKQRIGIARALVGNPSLFVLDEPTSALDEESEQWVMRTLSELRQSRFVVVITHRPSTLQHCDTVIQLSEGRVESTYSR